MKLKKVIITSLLIGLQTMDSQSDQPIRKYKTISKAEFSKKLKKNSFKHIGPGKYELINKQTGKKDTIFVLHDCGGCGMG